MAVTERKLFNAKSSYSCLPAACETAGSFDGVTTGVPLAIASVAYAPNPTSNIMVFIGGVAQTPGAGNAYTIAGSNISFVSPPPTGASFYATTVRN